MSYWCCGQFDGRREALALHCLGLAGYRTYVPRIRSSRSVGEALFPTYVFISIELQWHTARWAPGVWKLIMSGEEPARVPDAVISESLSRERDGLIVLPPPPASAPQFRPGDKVRVKTGPLVGFPGLISTMKARQRVEVLLQMLGSLQRVELAAADVERALVRGAMPK